MINETFVIGFLIGAGLASVAWYFLKSKNNSNIDPSTLFEKDKEIGILATEKTGLLQRVEDLKQSLTSEKEVTQKQLETINKIDQYKNTITNYAQTTEERNKIDQKNINEMKIFFEKLMGSSRYQGEVGEKILEKILNSCGYLKGRDYELQTTDKVVQSDETVKTVKPDAFIKMVDNTYIAVDSKVSLDNWRDWTRESDESKKKEHLKKHAESVKTHINKLSSKNYFKSIGRKVFPATIMFIPLETGYLAAIEQEPDLNEIAYKKNIILANPSNIMAVIKIIDTLKAKEKQIENFEEITKKASSIYDKYAILKSSLKRVITTFNSHGDNLRNVINSGWVGRGNLEKQIEDLKSMGVEGTKPIEKTTSEEEKIDPIIDLGSGPNAN
jgi:DNA recombination protein RmuC